MKRTYKKGLALVFFTLSFIGCNAKDNKEVTEQNQTESAAEEPSKVEESVEVENNAEEEDEIEITEDYSKLDIEIANDQALANLNSSENVVYEITINGSLTEAVYVPEPLEEQYEKSLGRILAKKSKDKTDVTFDYIASLKNQTQLYEKKDSRMVELKGLYLPFEAGMECTSIEETFEENGIEYCRLCCEKDNLKIKDVYALKSDLIPSSMIGFTVKDANCHLETAETCSIPEYTFVAITGIDYDANNASVCFIDDSSNPVKGTVNMDYISYNKNDVSSLFYIKQNGSWNFDGKGELRDDYYSYFPCNIDTLSSSRTLRKFRKQILSNGRTDYARAPYELFYDSNFLEDTDIVQQMECLEPLSDGKTHKYHVLQHSVLKYTDCIEPSSMDNVYIKQGTILAQSDFSNDIYYYFSKEEDCVKLIYYPDSRYMDKDNNDYEFLCLYVDCLNTENTWEERVESYKTLMNMTNGSEKRENLIRASREALSLYFTDYSKFDSSPAKECEHVFTVSSSDGLDFVQSYDGPGTLFEKKHAFDNKDEVTIKDVVIHWYQFGDDGSPYLLFALVTDGENEGWVPSYDIDYVQDKREAEKGNYDTLIYFDNQYLDKDREYYLCEYDNGKLGPRFEPMDYGWNEYRTPYRSLYYHAKDYQIEAIDYKALMMTDSVSKKEIRLFKDMYLREQSENYVLDCTVFATNKIAFSADYDRFGSCSRPYSIYYNNGSIEGWIDYYDVYNNLEDFDQSLIK